MSRNSILATVGTTIILAIQFTTPVCAQGFGSFSGGGLGGGGAYNSGTTRQYPTTHEWNIGAGVEDQPLSPEAALSVIKIIGTAEQRVDPEQIRVVLAVTSEGDTAEECRKKLTDRTQKVIVDWKGLKISEQNIVEDFISVLPRYEWKLEQDFQGWSSVRRQELAGYRMQSNLHVAVANEAEAMKAIDAAFRHGHAEVVTFDYWSSDLDRHKEEVRAKAVAAAKKKAELLLAVFEERPRAINVQESTSVYFPQSLYKTYENVLEEEVSDYGRDRPVLIKQYRPKMTFYHGLTSRADVRPKDLPMRPEIAVVSTVRIYYQSPAEGPAVPGSSSRFGY